MLMPKRTNTENASRADERQAGRGNTLSFGEFGLQALEPCWMTSRQIEAAARHCASCQARWQALDPRLS